MKSGSCLLRLRFDIAATRLWTDPEMAAQGGLEDAAELEEPLLVAGVAHAAANQDGTEEGLCEDAAGEVPGKFRGGEGIAIHFADFGKAGDVDLFAYELGQGEDFVEVAGSAEEILVADELVEAGCAGA